MSPAAAAALTVVLTRGGGTIALGIVTVSWFSPESMTSCWPARKPNGTCSRTPVAPTAVAPLSVVRSALSASWSITVARSANEVVTANVFVYLAALPAVSCTDTACVCLPTVSRLSATVFGTMNWPSSSIRRIAAPPAPPAPLATVSLASRRRGSVRSGVSVWDCRILPSTIDGW